MPQITQLAEVFASQLFWLAIFFGLIFLVIARGMLPKIRSTVDDRDAKVAEDLKHAQAARAGAEQTEAAWRERMDATRQDAARLAQEAKQASARETEARIKEALDEIDAKVERARLRIRDAVASARAEMETVATEAAQQMVQQLTGIKVDKKEALRAIEAQLVDMRAPNSQQLRAEMPVKHILS
jgi:F-type H+-transporting ATPase subunit b